MAQILWRKIEGEVNTIRDDMLQRIHGGFAAQFAGPTPVYKTPESAQTLPIWPY